MRLATAFTESGNTRLANPIAFDSGDAATRWTPLGLRRPTWADRSSTPAVASLSALARIASSSTATTRSYPSSADSFASSNPIPLEEPVTSARLVLAILAGYPTPTAPNARSSAPGFVGEDGTAVGRTRIGDMKADAAGLDE